VKFHLGYKPGAGENWLAVGLCLGEALQPPVPPQSELSPQLSLARQLFGGIERHIQEQMYNLSVHGIVEAAD
jgi:hypothetical protein